MRHHIVKIELEYVGNRPMPEKDYARQIMPEVIGGLEAVSERISGEAGSPGLFLVSQQELLRWMASSRIYHEDIQIDVFSLQGPEGQLVFSGGEDGCGQAVNYRISKRRED